MIVTRRPGGASVFWLDRAVPPPRPALRGDTRCAVAVIGAGFTGLWTALELRAREPGLDVVVLEADAVGRGASGRNGGFLDPSLTHGLANGVRHFPAELDVLERLGEENYRSLRAALATYGIDCDFEPVGMLEVATREHEVADLAAAAELEAAHGHGVQLLDADEARERLHSPLVLAGLRRPDAGGVLDPAKLVRGLADAAVGAGARLHEGTPVTGLSRRDDGVEVTTPYGVVRADRVVLATNAYSGRLLRRTARRFVPVYDYVLVSEPLTAEQRAAVGWADRAGVSDSGNRFHYFRLTADDRILWGGYDAVYYPRGGVGPRYDQRPATHATLEHNFAAMFPQLAGLAFPYRWGGPIATTTRFTATFGTALGGRLVYALGYTGLGVAATKFAARVLADRLLDPASDLLRLDFVRRPPVPFPPEPARWLGITATRLALARADQTGRRGLLLRTLDRLGIGFDS